jgi:hypothetical protein
MRGGWRWRLEGYALGPRTSASSVEPFTFALSRQRGANDKPETKNLPKDRMAAKARHHCSSDYSRAG